MVASYAGPLHSDSHDLYDEVNVVERDALACATAWALAFLICFLRSFRCSTSFEMYL